MMRDKVDGAANDAIWEAAVSATSKAARSTSTHGVYYETEATTKFSAINNETYGATDYATTMAISEVMDEI